MILLIGNQITNDGYYNPQEFLDILERELPQMLEQRIHFKNQQDHDAINSLTFFILEMFGSYQATRDILDVEAPSALEIMFEEQFFSLN